MERGHVLLLTFPAQGHINPSLQFAKKLINMGIQVTFITSISARRRMSETTTANLTNAGLAFVAFSDGYDDGYTFSHGDSNRYMVELRTHGVKALFDTVSAAADQGRRPITCLVYTVLLPWAAEVARDLHIPSAHLWIQPATVLTIYYHYFNGFEDEITNHCDDPEWNVEIPGAPLLSKRDLPSFFLPSSSDTYNFVLPVFKEQFDVLNAEMKPKILVNSFDALEPDAFKGIDRYEMIGVGPLIPSDDKDPSEKSFSGDLFQKSDDYIEWLNSKPKSSVVYVSFGSLLMLQKPQLKEVAKGLLDAGRPFLWVIRANEEKEKEKEKEKHDEEEDDEELVYLEELKKIGKIVPWCSQLEVLRHPSLGCFVSHCGWNSTLESVSCGVPVVAFPHWTDQGTNAKLIEDVWRTGVRVRFNDDGIVESGEILRCVEEVMDGGERSRELRGNAEKWRGLAMEAAGENGSSTKNLKAFFGDIVPR